MTLYMITLVPLRPFKLAPPSVSPIPPHVITLSPTWPNDMRGGGECTGTAIDSVAGTDSGPPISSGTGLATG